MRRWFPFWSIFLLVPMAIGTVWLRLSIVRTSYAINGAESDARRLQQEREGMELRVTGLRSPRRLELLARSKFHLTQPRSEQIVHLRDPGAAVAADNQD